MDSAAANAEGWDVFDSYGSDNGPYQVCRIDDPERWHADRELAFVPPYLESDDEAWQIVMRRHDPHHAKAREFIKEHNPKEWIAMCKFVGQEP